MSTLELTQASGLKPAVDALRRLGINVDYYLHRNGIPPDFIELPYAPIPKRRRLWKFLDDVERSEGLETLGFLMDKELDLTDIGPFWIPMSKAKTLSEVVTVLHHNVANFAQRNTIHLERCGDHAWLVCESFRKTCRPADHFTLMFLIAVVRLAAGPDWRPAKARLQTDEVAAVRALPLFEVCELEFNQKHAGVYFPAALLDLPLPGRDPNDEPGSFRLTPIPDTGRLSDSLRVIIATLLPYRGPPGAEEAAEMAGLSRATLFRHLASEGVTYKQLVEEIRLRAAREYLSRPAMTVKDVAYLVGYTQPNNFVRAFRNFAGITPTAFRQERALDA
jgi:AraC-like DNA-binding protein